MVRESDQTRYVHMKKCWFISFAFMFSTQKSPHLTRTKYSKSKICIPKISKKIPGTPPPAGTIALAVPPLHTNAKRRVQPLAAHDETSGKAVLPLLCPDPRDGSGHPNRGRPTGGLPLADVYLFIRNSPPKTKLHWNWSGKLQFMLRKQKIELLLGPGQGWHLKDLALKLCNPRIRAAGWFGRLQNLSNAVK